MGLVQATNGDLCGTTLGGGTSGAGTLFKITPHGALTLLHSFCAQSACADGYDPNGLVLGADGDLYGTAGHGGPNVNGGTVFKITPSGTLTTLYGFCPQNGCPDGADPAAGLVQTTNGDFYGTTYYGGADGVLNGGEGGTVFKITPSGTLTTVYSFCSQGGSSCSDGTWPDAALVQAANGNIYGTTPYGGAHALGIIFKITPNDTLTTLYNFCSQSGCADGMNPGTRLVQATNGDLYGVTVGGNGSIFKITLTGTLTTLYTFCSQSSCRDGKNPVAGLVQATDGNLYATTSRGGANGVVDGGAGDGTIFRITPAGTLTTVYSFCSQSGCADGGVPTAELVQHTDGKLYGVTSQFGAHGHGTVFSLSIGLGPFVKTQPSSGSVGAPVRILGSDLTGATRVTFNGTPATFSVVSPSLIAATVPPGATTGEIQVVTTSATLTSNVPFRVRP